MGQEELEHEVHSGALFTNQERGETEWGHVLGEQNLGLFSSHYTGKKGHQAWCSLPRPSVPGRHYKITACWAGAAAHLFFSK